jgi:hypothetical protein
MATRVTTLETALQNHINPPLVLEIKSLTSPILQGGKASLVAKADPGARVAISLKLPAGQAQPSGLSEKTVGKDGQVTWSWTVAKTLPAGSYAILVASSYEGKTASQSTNLVVTAPAPAPAPVKAPGK